MEVDEPRGGVVLSSKAGRRPTGLTLLRARGSKGPGLRSHKTKIKIKIRNGSVLTLKWPDLEPPSKTFHRR